MKIVFDVELTNRCNCLCAMCPRDRMQRPLGMMSEAIFHRLIGQMKTLPPEWEVAVVGFSGLGECLLHPSAPEFLRHAKTALGVKTCITTNGLLLDGRMASRLVEAGVNEVFISVHGIGKRYGEMCGGGSFVTVRENVKRFVETAAGCVHTVILAVETELNREHVNSPEFAEFWNEEGADHVEILKCHSRGGNLSDNAVLPVQTAPLPKECHIFLPFQFIAWNGDLLACCSDMGGDLKIGNIGKTSLRTLLKKKAGIGNPRRIFGVCAKCPDNYPADKTNMDRT